MRQSALEKLRSISNLETVWKEVWRRSKNKTSSGVDRISASDFNKRSTYYIREIRKELRSDYQFKRLKAVPIEKPDTSKVRIICVPTIQDRLVQRALLNEFENYSSKLGILNEISFGFIKGASGKARGATQARDYALQLRQKYPWALKTDIQSFFDRIPRDQMYAELVRSFRCKSLYPLLGSVIKCEIDYSDNHIRRLSEKNGIIQGEGLRQGMPLSPMFSNILLKEFDRSLQKRKMIAVRYADDIVVFAASRDECDTNRGIIENELLKLKLKVSELKTYIRSPSEPVDFLGLDLVIDASGTARLMISESQVTAVREKFTQLHDYHNVVRRGMDARELLVHLNNMRTGYRMAYGVASNREDFFRSLDSFVAKCIDTVYSSIFGASAIAHLTLKQRSFLGLQ